MYVQSCPLFIFQFSHSFCVHTCKCVSIQFEEHTFALRTKATHLQQCQALEDADDPDEISKEFGINRRSNLLDLCHFDMCSGSLIPDVMHDLLEGVLQHILKQLLHVLTNEKKYFTLTHLNNKIEGMELGYMEDSRPSPILRRDQTMRQNGNIVYMYVTAIALACTCTCTLFNVHLHMYHVNIYMLQHVSLLQHPKHGHWVGCCQ